ncbi:MAG: hypothetical protein U9Q77_10420 [Candidatus Marinimicrobia bacterium]|nr:hypothetical protein [Candidatus Neomarinimicrobiota bacterium]
MKNICFSIIQPLQGCNYCGSFTTGYTRGYSDYSPSGNLDLSKRWKLPNNPTNSEVRIMTMSQNYY